MLKKLLFLLILLIIPIVFSTIEKATEEDSGYTVIIQGVVNVNDTNETTRFNALTGNCTAGNLMFGVGEDGSRVCVPDATASLNLTIDDTNASTACSYTEVLLGNGSCHNSTLFYDDTTIADTTIDNCSDTNSCANIVYDIEINKSYVDTQDDLINSSSNIQSFITAIFLKGLGFNTTTELKTYFDTLYILVGGTFGGDVSGTYDNILVENTQGLSGENITSGIVADVRIASTITRDADLAYIDNCSVPNICPTINYEIEFNKTYSDSQDNFKMNITGGNFSDNVRMGNFNITFVDFDIFHNGSGLCIGSC